MGNINVGFITSRGSIKEQIIDPGRVCLIFEEKSYTYGELAERVNKLANSLLEMGIQKGDRIAILLPNCLEWFDIIFAAAKVGAVYIPVNILFKTPEVKYIVENSESKWMFVGEALLGSLQPIQTELTSVQQFICVGESCPEGFINYDEVLERGHPGEPEIEVNADDLYLFQYTSGTTGFPKGAMHTHSTVLWNSYHQIPDFGLNENDIFLNIFSMCWTAGIHDFTLALLWMGGRTILMPSGGLDLGRVLSIIEREQVTLWGGTPTVIRMLLQMPDLNEFDVSSLRLVLSGAEPVPIKVIEDFSQSFPGKDLLQVYGLSEFPSLATFLRSEYAVVKIGSAGKANSIAQVRVVDEKDRELGPGMRGEIVIKSPAGMIGYWEMPEATAEALRGGWLHTGDLGHVDEDGFLYVVSRSKDMYISGGLNVYPAEVEVVLLGNPKVAEVAIMGVPDEKWGEVGKAIVVLRPGEEASSEEMISFLKERLANYKIPRYVEFRSDPLPKTVSGKIMKYMLG
jgi:fatty-acyl-CoA synthase